MKEFLDRIQFHLSNVELVFIVERGLTSLFSNGMVNFYISSDAGC